MHGCRLKERKKRKIAFGVGGCKHIQIVPIVELMSGRVIAAVGARLGVIAAAGTIFLFAFAKLSVAVSCRSDNFGAVTGQDKA